MTVRRAATITEVEVRDVRFPTSRGLDGSDAMNADPDYSATYVILHTDDADRLQGHGLTFTIGRGNELCVAAVRALVPFVVGLSLEDIAADMGTFTVVKSSHPTLTRSVRTAVAKWKFSPAEVGGCKVPRNFNGDWVTGPQAAKAGTR